MSIKKAMERCSEIALKENEKHGTENIVRKVIKLSEETGEFAAAYLMKVGSKGTKKTPEQIEDNFLEEGCDVTLVILSILIRSGYTLDQIAEKLQTKMDKWERQSLKK